MHVEAPPRGAIGDPAVEALGRSYMAAWEAQDIHAILDHHTEDTVFTSVATGRSAQGRTAVAAAFGEIFAVWPDLRFQVRRLHAAAGLLVVESTASGTQWTPLPIADVVVQPTGRKVSFEVADIFPLRDGKISRKDTYFDAYAYIRAMRPDSAGS